MTNHQIATVRVPATTANLGPGFDSLGIALDWFGTYTVTLSDSSVPPPPGPIEQMTASAVLSLFQQAAVPIPAGITVNYEGDIPVGRGFGVSKERIRQLEFRAMNKLRTDFEADAQRLLGV